MKVLVINAGSSSLKYQLIDMEDESVKAKGLCERITIANSKLTQTAKGKKHEIVKDMPNHTVAMELVLEALVDPVYGAIKDVSEIGAVGHRVLHSGDDFDSSVLVTDETMKITEGNVDLGPLHMPANIACIKSCKEVMPSVPMAMVFDTTFHSTMPAKAYMYAIEYDVYKKYKVRKYGFHGTSHKFVSQIATNWLNKDNSKIVTCHLGNGSSISAVKDGKCVDTSMGFTPLEGLIMGTRSGDIDPAAVDFIGEKLNLDRSEMVTYLNKKCGFLGISGISSDCRDLSNAMAKGNERAKLAIDMLIYRIKRYIGGYAAAMGGLDMVVFTGGIGEHDEYVRSQVLKDLEFLGIKLDENLNNGKIGDDVTEISAKDSKVKVAVIPTNEELVIARETAELAR